MMAKIWGAMALTAVVFGLLSGRIEAVASAVTEGCSSCITLVISITGIMCFWSGIMEIMSSSGLAGKVAKAVNPLLKFIFGDVAKDKEASEYISANVTANLLGLANAATPLGLKAAERINKISGDGVNAPDALIRLVVLNSASLQLIPTTVAALRASLGAANPYDIIVPVWIASIISVSAGLLCARLLENKKRRIKK